jgi:hypothetical protein
LLFFANFTLNYFQQFSTKRKNRMSGMTFGGGGRGGGGGGRGEGRGRGWMEQISTATATKKVCSNPLAVEEAVALCCSSQAPLEQMCPWWWKGVRTLSFSSLDEGMKKSQSQGEGKGEGKGGTRRAGGGGGGATTTMSDMHLKNVHPKLEKMLVTRVDDMDNMDNAPFLVSWRVKDAPVFTVSYRGLEAESLKNSPVLGIATESSKTVFFSHDTGHCYAASAQMQLCPEDPPLIVQCITDVMVVVMHQAPSQQQQQQHHMPQEQASTANATTTTTTTTTTMSVKVVDLDTDSFSTGTPMIPGLRMKILHDIAKRWELNRLTQKHAPKMDIMWAALPTKKCLKELVTMSKTLPHTMDFISFMTSDPMTPIYVDPHSSSLSSFLFPPPPPTPSSISLYQSSSMYSSSSSALPSISSSLPSSSLPLEDASLPSEDASSPAGGGRGGGRGEGRGRGEREGATCSALALSPMMRSIPGMLF